MFYNVFTLLAEVWTCESILLCSYWYLWPFFTNFHMTCSETKCVNAEWNPCLNETFDGLKLCHCCATHPLHCLWRICFFGGKWTLWCHGYWLDWIDEFTGCGAALRHRVEIVTEGRFNWQLQLKMMRKDI